MSATQLGIFTAIQNVMKDLEPIGKNQKNAQQGFSFRGIDDLYNYCSPVMAKHGIFTVPNITGVEQREITSNRGTTGTHVIVRYKWIFYATDGSFVTAETIGEAMDYGDKAFNKACSIAHKYALLTVFSIPTKDLEDPDREAHEIVKPKKNEPIPLDVDAEIKKSFPGAKVEQNYGKAEDFKMPFGKLKGKKLSEIPYDELLKIYAWVQDKKMTGEIERCLKEMIDGK